ncbi:ZIP family metal transporter [Paenibacillus sambharensis]|uniref:ZIP family metal transporter n=1 Tax=Paenibacillus sambharensis TaxID=1803190 RepID=A0A2W1LMG8_9BACL|nr:ZIP family metal transporter [Paenibacillus sambharensis]PZD96172.1 ZIP family metal transporter [Paenibacillus sambharensis]
MNLFLSLSAAAAACTAAGALPALLIRSLTHRVKDILLAFSAGIMVAASTYGLLPSALKLSNFITLTIGIILGTLLLTVMELLIPHTDPAHTTELYPPERGSPQLLVLAMLLHNLPEGLSTGISLASSDQELGRIVTFAMGLQNIPEGFLIALFLVTQGSKLSRTFTSVMLVVLAEWTASLIGYLFGLELQFLVPYGLAFAGGAMLYVVYKELIPESHGDGHEIPSTFAFIIGTLFMIGLTEWLG